MAAAVDRPFSSDLSLIKRLNYSLQHGRHRDRPTQHCPRAPLRLDVPLLDPCSGHLSAASGASLGLKNPPPFICLPHVYSDLRVPPGLRDRARTAEPRFVSLSLDASPEKDWNSRRIHHSALRAWINGENAAHFNTETLFRAPTGKNVFEHCSGRNFSSETPAEFPSLRQKTRVWAGPTAGPGTGPGRDPRQDQGQDQDPRQDQGQDQNRTTAGPGTGPGQDPRQDQGQDQDGPADDRTRRTTDQGQDQDRTHGRTSDGQDPQQDQDGPTAGPGQDQDGTHDRTRDRTRTGPTAGPGTDQEGPTAGPGTLPGRDHGRTRDRTRTGPTAGPGTGPTAGTGTGPGRDPRQEQGRDQDGPGQGRTRAGLHEIGAGH
ncbi:hypothetical protein WMY93_018251 [Mugilogobius chulae]|uniref:Uncharacterized protein n=1 Tax=Mugilogobius chulae TaxID=88201 RepID=A0AAW0NN67_9GOBI